MMGGMSFFAKLRVNFFGALGRNLLPLWFKTSPLTVLGEVSYSQLRAQGKPVVFAVWHGRLFIVPTFFKRRNVVAFISPSRDGDILVSIGKRWGYKILRGSSSHAVAKSWVKMIQELRQGGEVIMVPDGPKGPNRTFKPGAIKLAQESGASIVPFSYSSSRKKYANSWDHFLWFTPFSKVVAIYGEPIEVPPNLPKDQFEEMRKRIEETMLALDDKADRYFDESGKIN